MSMNRLVRVPALALTLAALPVLAGCGGSNPFSPPPDLTHTLPKDTPPNDSPQNTMIRFQRAYQYQDITQYTNLLTSDFRYTFSAQSDPTLNTTYPNWGKDDETESTKHLLTGFTNASAVYVPPASNITIQFINDQYYLDPLHSDSLSFYRYCPVTTVNLNIDVPVDGGGSTTYIISAAHSFYLVRGDAAILDPGQAADSTHWYIRHWDDLSPKLGASTIQVASAHAPLGTAGSTGGATSMPITWGGLKGSYRR